MSQETQAVRTLILTVVGILTGLALLFTLITFRVAIFGAVWKFLTWGSLWWFLLGIVLTVFPVILYTCYYGEDYIDCEGYCLILMMPGPFISPIGWEFAFAGGCTCALGIVGLFCNAFDIAAYSKQKYMYATLYAITSLGAIASSLMVGLGLFTNFKFTWVAATTSPWNTVGKLIGGYILLIPITALLGGLVMATRNQLKAASQQLPVRQIPENTLPCAAQPHELTVTPPMQEIPPKSSFNFDTARKIRPMTGKVYPSDHE